MSRIGKKPVKIPAGVEVSATLVSNPAIGTPKSVVANVREGSTALVERLLEIAASVTGL